MALRLTQSQPAADEPTKAVASTAAFVRSVHAVGGRASVALLSQQFDAYRAMFAEADELEDPSRRYFARKTLIETGLATARRLRDARAAEVLLATAQAAVGVLELEPAEPVLLNYAGVAFHELWSSDVGQALFAAAERLDPTLPHLRRNIADAKARRRSGAGRRRRFGVTPELAGRAMAVAQRAKPATGLTLSLCMIVRDEQEMLPRCLSSVAPAVDEIVIVDTGSQDRTIEIARSFGARVIEREWTGSFAEPRNVAFEAATGDWMMYLDADEVLEGDDVERLRALTGETWREAFYLIETNYTGDRRDGTSTTHCALRVFRNRPTYRFAGRLHEQIYHSLPGYLPERIRETGVRVTHYGYLSAVRESKEKSKRNIELLLKQKEESAPTPFLHYNLGSEYFAAGDPASALAEYELAWQGMHEAGMGVYQFTPSLCVRMVRAMRMVGRAQDAFDRATEGLSYFPGLTDLVYEQGAAMQELGRIDEAVELFKRSCEMGPAPARYTSESGCGTYLPRLALAELHMQRGEIDKALKLLRWCARHHPEYFGLILPYAAALLRAGRGAEEVVFEIERCVPEPTPTVRFMLGIALFERGHAPEAEAQFRLVLASQPHNGRARLALSETLGYQGRYLEEADEAAKLADDEAFAAAALRGELFGRIAGGDLAGARLALDAALLARPADPETAVFANWLARRAADREPPRVPASGAVVLEVMLDALLRLKDFDNFNGLVEVFGSLELPLRDQRELIARLYLKRGHLKAAAREWITVVGGAPDERALVGLARVAVANGQHEPAAEFARQALALDPRCGEASEILERLASSELAVAS